MPRLNPISPEQAGEDVARTYDRIRELLGSDDLPEPFLIFGNVEPFLRDFYMNYKKFVHTDGAIDAKTKAAVALCVAVHGKSKPWQDYFEQRCRDLDFSEQQTAELLAVAATNYMYNTFFKFRDISGTDLFDGMGVGLRAHTFNKTSLDETLVELVNVAISDLNACQPCTKGHVEKARKLGLSPEQILECIQCAATMYAGVQFLNAAT
jgi:lipoyl-dependent peroxiredoxin subunit D